MAEVTTYRCDECGTLKKESNHWYHAYRLSEGGFAIMPFAQAFKQNAFHLCGMGCAVKAMQDALTEEKQ